MYTQSAVLRALLAGAGAILKESSASRAFTPFLTRPFAMFRNLESGVFIFKRVSRSV